MMRVTYLGHSGFLVELEDTYFLFDYYKGSLPKMDTEKKILVFVSHAHYDHYRKEIFTLRDSFSRIRFVLSSDIFVREAEDVVSMKPNEETVVFGCRIRTLRSTDEGVAFLVHYRGRTALPCRRPELVALGRGDKGREYTDAARLSVGDQQASEGEDRCGIRAGGSEAGRAVLLGTGLLYEAHGHKEGYSPCISGKSIQYSTDFPSRDAPRNMRTGSSGSSGRDRPSCWKNKRAERLELCL